MSVRTYVEPGGSGVVDCHVEGRELGCVGSNRHAASEVISREYIRGRGQPLTIPSR